MKLKKQIVKRLSDDRSLRLSLAMGLEFTELWIERLIKANKNNGPLTTESSLKVLRAELKMDNTEILEEESVKA